MGGVYPESTNFKSRGRRIYALWYSSDSRVPVQCCVFEGTYLGVRHAFAAGSPILPGSTLCCQGFHCAGSLAQALTELATEEQGGDAGFITPRDRMVFQVRRHFHHKLAPYPYRSQVPIRVTLNVLNKAQAPNCLLIITATKVHHFHSCLCVGTRQAAARSLTFYFHPVVLIQPRRRR